MTPLSETQMKALAQRISDLGTGVDVTDYLGALGMVVFNALMQLTGDDRAIGTVAWVATLTRQIAQAETKRRQN